MPSIEQLRYEALADAVERAKAPLGAMGLFASGPEPLIVRVQAFDGRAVKFRLLEVDLDGNELVGRDARGGQVRLPLSSVKTVWRRRRSIGRSASSWFSFLVAGSLAGALVALWQGGSEVVAGAAAGGLLGAIGGFGFLVVFEDWEALNEWTPLYERAAA